MKANKNRLVLIVFVGFLFTNISAQELFKVIKGNVNFTSDAPLEVIKAASDKLTGLIKTSDKSFAFMVNMKSFQGFNSALQRSHFNENYIESDKYPNAIFEGKIIEDIDFSKSGKYDIRGKGKFTVHGVEQVRIIKCMLVISKDKISVNSKYSVLLEDHNIKIPSIVNQKIANEILVEVEAELIPSK